MEVPVPRWLQCGRGPKPTEIRKIALSEIARHQLQCGRGPKPTEILIGLIYRIRIGRFNVAAGRSPRKCHDEEEHQEGTHASMWPRAEAHGNTEQARVRPAASHASMWPRAEAHGNRNAGDSASGMSALQCGRGPKPTEIVNLLLKRGGKEMLQCGRGPKPTEIGAVRVSIVDIDAASMWPRAEAHGNLTIISPLYRLTPRFNVAAGRSPRKFEP